MEVDWLEDFLALASAGVFSRAAEARNISPAAFTRRIKNLEHWAGAPLFNRNVHPVELTEAGRAFRPTAIETINALKMCRHDLRDLSRQGTEVVNFIALHTLAISFFPGWLRRITERLGPLKTRVVAENYSGCAEAILSGSADFMLCYAHASVRTIADANRHPSITVAQDRLIAVSAADARGEARHRLDGARQTPFLCYSLDSFLGQMSDLAVKRGDLRDRLSPVYENSVAEALKAACLEGHGIAFLPAVAVQKELKARTLVRISQPAFEPQITVKLYRSAERARPVLERIWQSCRTQPDQHAPGPADPNASGRHYMRNTKTEL